MGMKTIDQTFLREFDKHVVDSAIYCCNPDDHNKNANIKRTLNTGKTFVITRVKISFSVFPQVS